MSFSLAPIGYLHSSTTNFSLQVDEYYRPGLLGLEGFSHALIIFGFHESPDFTSEFLQCESPYRGSPDSLGVFATRSPFRPNGLGVTVCPLLDVDVESGVVTLGYHDGFEGTPVFDLKPYTPSVDRVENPLTPQWSASWPSSVEASATFDWQTVFSF